MAYENQENIVLRDWLSFTSQTLSPQEIIKYIGLTDCQWIETKGARGYKDRLYFGGISVHYNGRDGMGVWCEFSGQGCRTFETYSSIDWGTLTAWLIEAGLNITRLDIAFDDHAGLLLIDEILKDTEEGNYLSRSDFWETIRSNKGSSLMIGSPQSLFRLRIYDKAAERAAKLKGEEAAEVGSQHWIRIEMQLRDERAANFLRFTKDYNIGQVFAGVLLNYVRYVTPSEDTNKSRWETAPYWQKVIGEAEKISLFEAPGVEYNYTTMIDNVIRQYGSAIHTAAMADDLENLLERSLLAYQKTSEQNQKKYDSILAERLKKIEEISGIDRETGEFLS
jgi:phage replication initiation protein